MKEGIELLVPRSLDDLPRLLLLDMYQAMLLLVMFGIGIVLDHTLAGTFAGIVLACGYGRLKAGRHPQFLMHLAYWHLPHGISCLQRTPPSHLRLYSG